MNRATFLVLSLSLLAGSACAHKKPEVTVVNVPVIVAPTPPSELLAPLQPQLPEFISPDDPKASSALSEEGERLLRALINDLLTRVQAWEAWAEALSTQAED